MNKATPRLPFRDLGPSEWTNLGMAALATLFLGFAAWMSAQLGMFTALGVDYRGFYAAGQIAATEGFAAVYDLSFQEAVQRPLNDAYSRIPVDVPYVTVPVLFLPPFIVPLMILPYLDPAGGFAAWTLLNGAALVLYFWRFARAIGCRPDVRLLAAVLLAAPVYLNLFVGQIGAWLVICTGEAFLAALRGKEFRSGLWLAGLLIKPQILVLVLPGLLIGRRWRALSGFGLVATALLLVSVQLAGMQGMADLFGLLTFHAAGPAAAAPQHMANWRSLAVNLEPVFMPALIWGLALAGMLLTAGVALSLWLRPVGSSPTGLALLWAGTFAATSAVTWHSHMHMALPVIVLLLYLALKGILPVKYLLAWLLLPSVVLCTAMLMVGAMLIWLGGATLDLAFRVTGLTLLALDVWVLLWARRALSAQPFSESGREPQVGAVARLAADVTERSR